MFIMMPSESSPVEPVLCTDDSILLIVQCFAIKLDGGNVGYIDGIRGGCNHHVSFFDLVSKFLVHRKRFSSNRIVYILL